jgi:hypothetical protein
MFKPLLDSVVKLEEKQAYHRDLVRCELERVRNGSLKEALAALDLLERSLRVLTGSAHDGA